MLLRHVVVSSRFAVVSRMAAQLHSIHHARTLASDPDMCVFVCCLVSACVCCVVTTLPSYLYSVFMLLLLPGCHCTLHRTKTLTLADAAAAVAATTAAAGGYSSLIDRKHTTKTIAPQVRRFIYDTAPRPRGAGPLPLLPLPPCQQRARSYLCALCRANTRTHAQASHLWRARGRALCARSHAAKTTTSGVDAAWMLDALRCFALLCER